MPPKQWASLQEQLARRLGKKSATRLFGDFAADGMVYRWGVAAACRGDVPVAVDLLSRFACCPNNNASLQTHPESLTLEAAQRLLQRPKFGENELVEAATAVCLASCLPAFISHWSEADWFELLAMLQRHRAQTCEQNDLTSPVHLLIAGELGLTLAWRCADLPSCQRLLAPSAIAVREYLDGGIETIDRLLQHPDMLRLVVASLYRCSVLCKRIAKSKLKKRSNEIAAEIATWMAALTRHDATPALSRLSAKQLRDDLSGSPIQQEELSGLMLAASRFDSETLAPAIGASLGHGHTGGRLAWEVSLPESMWHSEQAGLAVMLPEWDVRRGRSYLRYDGEDVTVEIMGGRSVVFAGRHQTMIEIDGTAQLPKGGWECTCEYSDDDVHTIELEQQFTGGVVLQRQWMLVRDDRCLMIADAVVPRTPKEIPTLADSSVRCVSRVPLAAGMTAVEEPETREIILKAGKKRRALCVPLAAGEWRSGSTLCQMFVSEDNHLVLETSGRGAVYCPLWVDFQTRRFSRKRTWRTLTVAQDLQIVKRHQAAAYRVQIGSEHWVIYRSLLPQPEQQPAPIRTPQSFMGKHVVADFFAARFHPGDGGMEELVTVDAADEDQSDDN